MIFSFLSHINSSRVIPTELRMQLQKYKLLFVSAVLIAALVLSACDKIPSGVVDSKIVDYSVEKIEAPVSVTYSKSDSSVTTTMWLANNESVNSIWCKISSVDGQIIINRKVSFQFVYDMIPFSWQRDLKTYSANFYMNKSNPNGKYQIEYFVEDNINQASGNLSKVGSAIFTYDNSQNNFPPVISDLTMPQSINRNVDFTIQLKVSDPNGLMDISRAEFSLYQPGGAYVSKFALLDDGNTVSDGDITAGDGIYSSKRSFRSDVTPGVWKFVFQATDLVGNLSNTITFNLTVN